MASQITGGSCFNTDGTIMKEESQTILVEEKTESDTKGSEEDS